MSTSSRIPTDNAVQNLYVEAYSQEKWDLSLLLLLPEKPKSGIQLAVPFSFKRFGCVSFIFLKTLLMFQPNLPLGDEFVK